MRARDGFPALRDLPDPRREGTNRHDDAPCDPGTHAGAQNQYDEPRSKQRRSERGGPYEGDRRLLPHQNLELWCVRASDGPDVHGCRNHPLVRANGRLRGRVRPFPGSHHDLTGRRGEQESRRRPPSLNGRVDRFEESLGIEQHHHRPDVLVRALGIHDGRLESEQSTGIPRGSRRDRDPHATLEIARGLDPGRLPGLCDR